tara:strand:- start:1081 stop:1476 length:396 start_codon:yes stop_codon:yes gene_type:complete
MLAKGIAIDKFTKEPLTRANVIITDEQGNVIENSKKTTSDDDGVFSIEVLPADYITISYVGYANKVVPISQFSSDIKTIPMTYLKSKDGNSGYFKETDTDNDGALTNRPISMWYWLAFGIIGYYIYQQVKK